MQNTKKSFLKMLKIHLQLRNTLIECILKMETKNLIRNRLSLVIKEICACATIAHANL